MKDYKKILKKLTLVVVIPCFNEEKTLRDVLRTIPKRIPGIKKIQTLVVDDGSTDRTVQVARKNHATHIVRHSRNKGLGVAFRTGRDAALDLGADIIVTIDADGQFDGAEIPALLAPILQSKADMVTGTRFLTQKKIPNMSLLKRYGNRLFTTVVNTLVSGNYTDTQCGFRAYTREAAMKLVLHGDFTYTQEVFLHLVDLGMVIREIPIRVKYFNGRTSRISGSLWGYGKNSIGIIARAARDIQPLKFFGIPAVIMFVSGIALGSFMFVRYVVLHQTSPYKTLIDVAMALVIMGILLMFMALMADMQKEFRHNQERILYLLRKEQYKKKL